MYFSVSIFLILNLQETLQYRKLKDLKFGEIQENREKIFKFSVYLVCPCLNAVILFNPI